MEVLNVSQLNDEYRPRLQSLVDQYGIQQTEHETIRKRVQKYIENINVLFIVNTIIDFLPIIRCLKEYNLKKNLFGDFLSGLTIAVMHIPQGIAYGVLAGVPAACGLYVSLFPVLVYMIFGTCPHLSIGTFAIISLMTRQSIDSIPTKSIGEKISIGTTLCFLVGSIQLLLSIFRLGFVTSYLSEPFISGFTTGAAIHVLISQLPSLFGVESPSNLPILLKLPRFLIKLIELVFTKINWMTTGLSCASILFLIIVKYLNDRYKAKVRIILPIELVLIVIVTLISYLLNFNEVNHVKIVGLIERGLPSVSFPRFDHFSSLISSSLTIAFLSFCINISLAKMFAKKHSYKVRSNQELFAYGMSNMISSLFQCYPSSASLSRSVMQDNVGGKTQLTAAISCLVLFLFVIVLAPLIGSLPMCCLSAIVIVNLKGMLLQIKQFLFYYRTSRYECILWTITFVTVVLSDVDIGLYVGLASSFVLNTVRTQKPRFAVLGRVGQTEFYMNMKLFPSAEQYSNIRILRFYGSLYACNSQFFQRKFYELIGMNSKEKTRNEYGFVILDCSPFNFIDTVAVQMLIRIYNDLKQREIQLYLSECRYDIRRMFDRMDFSKQTDERILFSSIHNAVLHIEKQKSI